MPWSLGDPCHDFWTQDQHWSTGHWLSLCSQPDVVLISCLMINNADRTYWEELSKLQVDKSPITVQQPKMWAQLLRLLWFLFGIIDFRRVVVYCLLEPACIVTASHTHST